MLANGSRVQVNKSGSTTKVEDLEIGEYVYCPIVGKSIEIIDILRRSVEFGDIPVAQIGNWWPRKIPKGSVSKSRPRSDLFVSPQQQILILNRKKEVPGSPPMVSAISAYEQFEAADLAIASITYNAIFLPTAYALVANSTLCLSYSSEMFTRWDDVSPCLVALRKASLSD